MDLLARRTRKERDSSVIAVTVMITIMGAYRYVMAKNTPSGSHLL